MAEPQPGWYKENYEGDSMQSPKYGRGPRSALRDIFTYRNHISVHTFFDLSLFLPHFLGTRKEQAFLHPLPVQSSYVKIYGLGSHVYANDGCDGIWKFQLSVTESQALPCCKFYF